MIICRGSYLDGRRYVLPTIEYEAIGDGRVYFCFAFLKWYFGVSWTTKEYK